MRGQPAHSVACTHSTSVVGISPVRSVARRIGERMLGGGASLAPPTGAAEEEPAWAADGEVPPFGPLVPPPGAMAGAYKATPSASKPNAPRSRVFAVDEPRARQSGRHALPFRLSDPHVDAQSA